MMVTRRVGRHDPTQLELKLAYGIDPTKKKQRYSVEAWIFVPRSLGLTRASYPRERFYEDTAAFVRVKTPTVALCGSGTEQKAPDHSRGAQGDEVARRGQRPCWRRR